VYRIKAFHREAGQNGIPTILLLQGFPNAGHVFRIPSRYSKSGFALSPG
jgi:hypothetical protein